MDHPDTIPGLSKDERTWGMLCHLLALAGLLGIPLGHIIGPLVMWLIKKNESDYVDRQGREALNFAITITIYAAACIPLCFVFIGFIILPVILLWWLVAVIIAAVKANDGRPVRYSLTIRFL